MIIIFVRHGHSEANKGMIFSNRVIQKIQHKLTETGIKQAETCADSLVGHRVTAIYSSPIFRARQTAK